mmetsp:Transcript_44762/g.70081  ORF Transcript_44762/g.70081 Transcript_44762/m.70081 type:complete len:288 (-) Transcript_44762:347-1210(-)|eukprot:CAMPEP_0184296786 /NCGR_PEP_ID=MMETSP1049-20130417/7749_1 /TAXON_ID=77928 /ORGANISM="Proteomonas sulcata, Strain CCMP704" /LENGTH=287 /DNA_ID=CAMNT_0026606203 /DNA_START=168 /DNA_END=1031 /DNA_ORIENTATION=-
MLRKIVLCALVAQATGFLSSPVSKLPLRGHKVLKSPAARTSSTAGALGLKSKLGAILFACDGVLADTERDGHRVALNEALKEFTTDGLEASVEVYGKLLNARGEERLVELWKELGWKDMDYDLAVKIYDRKTEIFQGMIEKGSIPIRPGILELIDEAIAANIPIAVCSSNTQRAVEGIVESMGTERASKIEIFAGGRVSRRKPSPDIYNLAKGTLGVTREDCVVVEDDQVGLEAAKAANMAVLITKSAYTNDDDFKQADLVVDSLAVDEIDLDAISKLPLSNVGLNV